MTTITFKDGILASDGRAPEATAIEAVEEAIKTLRERVK